jgi:hypothetical protein
MEGSLLTALCGLAFAIGLLAKAQSVIFFVHAV